MKLGKLSLFLGIVVFLLACNKSKDSNEEKLLSADEIITNINYWKIDSIEVYIDNTPEKVFFHSDTTYAYLSFDKSEFGYKVFAGEYLEASVPYKIVDNEILFTTDNFFDTDAVKIKEASNQKLQFLIDHTDMEYYADSTKYYMTPSTKSIYDVVDGIVI